MKKSTARAHRRRNRSSGLDMYEKKKKIIKPLSLLE